jgi:hypothetical protein
MILLVYSVFGLLILCLAAGRQSPVFEAIPLAPVNPGIAYREHVPHESGSWSGTGSRSESRLGAFRGC